MDAVLTEPARWWTYTHVPGSQVERAMRVVAHLIRGDHTLCGRVIDPAAWQVSDPAMPVCSKCAEIGPTRFTHRDLTQAAGITYRQLDQWIFHGYLQPDNPAAGQGTSRMFSAEELKVARRMGVLVAAGLRPGAAARAALGAPIAPGVRVVFDDDPEPT